MAQMMNVKPVEKMSDDDAKSVSIIGRDFSKKKESSHNDNFENSGSRFEGQRDTHSDDESTPGKANIGMQLR
jgi:hypothetical protein